MSDEDSISDEQDFGSLPNQSVVIEVYPGGGRQGILKCKIPTTAAVNGRNYGGRQRTTFPFHENGGIKVFKLFAIHTHI